jgi:hypothetical protein
MILMPSNNTGKVVRDLFKKYHDKIALLMSPDGFRKPPGMYALDNGAFKRFNEQSFFKMLDSVPKLNPPIFVVCPDVVGCHDRTIALWHYYYPKLKPYGFQLAFTAQDGCTPEAIPDECDWIFIGGTNGWKSKNIEQYIGMRPVHVGRVNSIGFVKYCESIGVASIDGTGWMRAKGKQYYDFINYFNGEVQLGLPT